jgi:hypothetical protein
MEMTVKFKNTGTKLLDEKGKPYVRKDTVTVKRLGLTVPFGGECSIPEFWTLPTRLSNGARGPSAIEQVAPQLEPSDEAAREEWMRVPPEAPRGGIQASGITNEALVAALVARGISRGVAENLVQPQGVNSNGSD